MHNIKRSIPVTFSPGPDLYLTIRGVLITQGTSLNEWCTANGLRRQSVEKVLKGTWRGRKADELRERVTAAVLPPRGAA